MNATKRISRPGYFMAGRFQGLSGLLVMAVVLVRSVGAASANKPAEYVPPEFERPPAAIAGATRHVFKDTGGFTLPIYVFAPPEKVPRPASALIFFHGSGWHSGTLMQFVAHARRLASLGLCTAVAEYRVKVFYDATPFDGLADAKSAVRWMRANAAMLGVDPTRVGVAGGSAGAHLALGTAVFEGEFDDPADDVRVSARPDLVVLFAAVTDTTKRDEDAAPNPLFGGRERELSPIHHLQPGLPPVQIFHGVDDPWAAFARVEWFADAMHANGDECDLIPFVGRSHFFYNHPDYYSRYPDFTPIRGEDDFELCLLLLSRFLHAHGFLSARPRVRD